MKNTEISIRKIAESLNRRKMTFVTAESCTGGYIAKTVTDVPGISSVFEGGIVSYSNSVKEKVLGVKHETLESYGAVSPQTALQMSKGALDATGADFAVSVTGIAGPGGGTAEKPVGTVYISCAGRTKDAEVKGFLFSGYRGEIREQTLENALWFLSEFIG